MNPEVRKVVEFCERRGLLWIDPEDARLEARRRARNAERAKRKASIIATVVIIYLASAIVFTLLDIVAIAVPLLIAPCVLLVWILVYAGVRAALDDDTEEDEENNVCR